MFHFEKITLDLKCVTVHNVILLFSPWKTRSPIYHFWKGFENNVTSTFHCFDSVADSSWSTSAHESSPLRLQRRLLLHLLTKCFFPPLLPPAALWAPTLCTATATCSGFQTGWRAATRSPASPAALGRVTWRTSCCWPRPPRSSPAQVNTHWHRYTRTRTHTQNTGSPGACTYKYICI